MRDGVVPRRGVGNPADDGESGLNKEFKSLNVRLPAPHPRSRSFRAPGNSVAAARTITSMSKRESGTASCPVAKSANVSTSFSNLWRISSADIILVVFSSDIGSVCLDELTTLGYGRRLADPRYNLTIGIRFSQHNEPRRSPFWHRCHECLRVSRTTIQSADATLRERQLHSLPHLPHGGRHFVDWPCTRHSHAANACAIRIVSGCFKYHLPHDGRHRGCDMDRHDSNCCADGRRCVGDRHVDCRRRRWSEWLRVVGC